MERPTRSRIFARATGPLPGMARKYRFGREAGLRGAWIDGLREKMRDVAGELEKSYLKRAARDAAGVIVFSPEVAIEIIEEAQRRSIPTFGLDAFLLHAEGKIQPDVEYDLSTRDHGEAVFHLRRFIGTSYSFEVSTD